MAAYSHDAWKEAYRRILDERSDQRDVITIPLRLSKQTRRALRMLSKETEVSLSVLVGDWIMAAARLRGGGAPPTGYRDAE